MFRQGKLGQQCSDTLVRFKHAPGQLGILGAYRTHFQTQLGIFAAQRMRKVRKPINFFGK